jgi:ligand-binding sensor domain-containing protein
LRCGALTVLLWMLGAPIANAAPALQLFSDPAQAISPVAIAEDDKGFLWIAADQGVFQFDGSHFLKIPGAFQIPAGIAVIGKRTVLVACNNGVFEYANGVTAKLTGESANTLVRLGDDIVLVLQTKVDREGKPIRWTAAAILEGTSLQLRTLDGIPGWMWPSAGGQMSFACGSHPCSLQNSDAFRQSIRAGNLKPYLQEHARVAAKVEVPSEFESMAMDASGRYFFRPVFSGRVWVRTSGGIGKEYDVGEFTRANGRAGLHTGPSGRIWIPGDDLYLAEGGNVSRFVAPQIDGIRVNCAFEDRRGRTWFGLVEKGLAVMGMGPVTESWFAPPSLGEIRSIVRGNASTVYATTTKGVMLMRKGHEEWRPIDGGKEGSKVVHLAPGDDGTLIGLTSIGPPVRLAADGKVLQRITPPPEMMLSSLRPLIRASDGSYLIGSMQSAPSVFRIRRNQVESIDTQRPGGNVHDVVEDSGGHVWVGYADGVCRIENTLCKAAIVPADGLLDSTIQSIGAGPPNELWIAYRSAKGFSRFRLVNGRWTPRHFLEADGYPTPDTHIMRRDRRGWVWRGTSQGLFVSDGVHVGPGDWVFISERDGLPSGNINRFGFLEDSDGSVWIGTARGIAHLNPNPAWFRTRGSTITSITFQGRKFLDTMAFPSVLQGPGDFSATAGEAGLLPVRYCLSPLDRTWRVSYGGDIKSQRLKPGRYELEVTTGTGGSYARYPFQVVPTTAARLRVLLLIVVPVLALFGLALFFWRRRLREARLPQLPDLAEARLAILSPDVGALIGTKLAGRFVPQKLIARGGFGTVFEGDDLKMSSRCAIKVFGYEFRDEHLNTQFQQEITALEAVQHPNVVGLRGHGTTPVGSTFLVMEFIEGSTLREVLKEGPVPPGTCSRFLRQIGCALWAIHSRNIFHRDLKPENLMVRRPAAATADIILIDFSMAIVKDPDRSLAGLSRAGGTLHYMAPEQALGHASAEGDIYSLAKVAIEMMTGRRITDLLPEATLDLSEQVRAFLQEQSLGLSPFSIELLASSLEFDPARRVKSVGDLIEPIAHDLEAFGAGGR